MANPQLDWQNIKEQVIEALEKGIEGWTAVSREIGISKTTLRDGLYREFGINSLDELIDKEPSGNEGLNVEDVSINEKVISYTGQIGDTIVTVDQLLEIAKIGLEEWSVDRAIINKWPVGRKDKKISMTYKDGVADGSVEDSGKIFVQPLFQVKVWISKKVLTPFMPTIQPIEISIEPVKAPKIKAAARSEVQRGLIVADPQFGFMRRLWNSELIPFHDRRVLDIALQILEKYIFDDIFLIGDFVDLSAWSMKFAALPEYFWTTQPALIELAWWLGKYRQASPNARMKLWEGNHEVRPETVINAHIKEAYELRAVDELDLPPALSVPKLLALHALGIEYLGDYPDNRFWINERTAIEHGDIARAGTGGTAKAVLSLKRYTSIYGHVHKREMLSERTIVADGHQIHTAFCPGCACHIDGRIPGAKSDNSWQQGIAVVEYTSGDENIIPIAIDNGKAIYNGEVLTARTLDTEIDLMLREKLDSIVTKFDRLKSK